MLYFAVLHCTTSVTDHPKKKKRKENGKIKCSFPFAHFSFSVSLSGFLPALTSCLCCRSSGSSEFWRSLSLHSQGWSSPSGWAAEVRLPSRRRGMKERSNSKRRHLHPQPEILFPMTASRQLGPMKSVSHDLRNNFLDCSCSKR